MEFLTNTLKNFSEFFSGLSFARKLAMVGTSVAIVAVMAGMFLWAGKTTYVTLVTNLTPEDSTAIIRYLRDKKIPFVVDETGKTVSVPPDKVYDLRLELSSSGLAQTGVVGYEVFDKQSFGTTSTVQRINEQRALEGELIRTINHIKGVERSRVHLAVPVKSAFLEDEKKPTASVILDIIPGVTLSEDQVHGIQHLVSSAVKGLDVNGVTIISNSGKQLSQNSDDPAAVFAAATMDYQRKFEAKMESKVESLLAKVVGEGKVIAKINADFDFSRISETQTLFDAENIALRSSNKDNNSMNGNRPLPMGAPGAKSNVPGQQDGINTPAVATNNTNLVHEVQNYEVPKTTRSTEKPVATLKRLSVAVMVDGNYVPDAKAPGGNRYEPLSAEKLAEFKSIIANTVGWDDKRDPAIEVKSLAFFKEDVESATNAANLAERNRLIVNISQWVGIGILFSLFFFFVVRPFIKWVTENTTDQVEDFLPKTLEELERAQAKTVIPGMEELLPEVEEKVDPEKIQGEMLKEKVLSLVNDNPHKSSQILHEWIHKAPVEPKDKKEKKDSA